MTVESRKRYMVNYNSNYYKRHHGKILQRQALYRYKNRVRTNEQQQCMLLFKDKQVKLDSNPRKGVCSECSKIVGVDIKTTHIHHDEYHDDDVLKNTRELCLSCHGKTKRIDFGQACIKCCSINVKRGTRHKYEQRFNCNDCGAYWWVLIIDLVHYLQGLGLQKALDELENKGRLGLVSRIPLTTGIIVQMPQIIRRRRTWGLE